MRAALISVNTLNDKFHTYAEQLTGVNPAEKLQEGRRPKSKLAYVLSYLRTFMDPQADTSDVRPLMGMLHLGILVAGGEIDMAEVTGYPHGLYCLSCPVNARQGVVGVVFMGTVDQWIAAIRNGLSLTGPVSEWSKACHNQLCDHGLGEYVGEISQKNGTLYLTN